MDNDRPTVSELRRRLDRLEALAEAKIVMADVWKAEKETMRAELAGLRIQIGANEHAIEDLKRASTATRNAVLGVSLALLANIVLFILSKVVS